MESEVRYYYSYESKDKLIDLTTKKLNKIVLQQKDTHIRKKDTFARKKK